MEKKYLIVGHGLAGCVLALTLYRKEIPFKIVGMSLPGEASMASSGLINPVTGRRYVKAWMIDELIEKALEFYGWTETLLHNSYFHPVDIVRFLSNQEARDAWTKRMEDVTYKDYISDKKHQYLEELQKPYGIVTGGYRLDTPAWLADVRDFLFNLGLLTYHFEPTGDTTVEYDYVIYATGATDKSISSGLIPNKGEAIIVRMPGWKYPGIIKEQVYFIPLNEDNMFWVGSHYFPWPADGLPTEEGRQRLLNAVAEVYSGGIELIQHLAGIRPTMEDRRPLIGPFTGHQGKFLFNGMGTKGTSLAPYWAEALIDHIRDGKPLPYLVTPSRYPPLSG